MTDAHAAVSQKRGINPIWFVPVIALLLGISMVVYTIQQEGPEITISFVTAEGIVEGKTKLKLRDVDVGVVEDVRLTDDAESVVVVASLENEAESLLRSDTQFWVVRPRIGKTGVSGLSTLLSGGYIQLAPGKEATGARDFVGLEDPPVTPAGTPGMRVMLIAERAGSVSAGDPIIYKGYTVGQVETEAPKPEYQHIEYDVFINAPYDKFLTTAHRFWNVSGVTAKLGADGFEIEFASLEALLIGGVQVGLPEGLKESTQVESGHRFNLYDNYAHVNQRPYRAHTEFVLEFAQSIRGLSPGAPVEYRGIRIGEVIRVMVTELSQATEGEGRPIPVLVRIEPARIELPDNDEGVATARETIAHSVAAGLRGSLATGSLLTGQLYIALDILEGAEEKSMGEFAGYATIPTAPSGIEGVLAKLTLFLEKLNELPLDQTVAGANDVLANVNALVGGAEGVPGSLEETLEELRGTLASLSADSELQTRLLPTITELERTLASLRSLLDTLDQQPNSLIFDRRRADDPRPPAGSQ